MKRFFLFIAVNLLIVTTLSLILRIFNVQPYLTANGIDMKALLLFCLIWGMGGALISLFLSKHLVKWQMGVKSIDPMKASTQELMLYELTQRIARSAGIQSVEVGIFPSHQLNAFATGATKRSALVAVSSGMLEKMSESEIEGVLGHEISHIRSGDMVTMTLLQGTVNAFAMFLSRILAYALTRGSNSRDRRSSPPIAQYLLTTLFEIVFLLFGSIAVASFSRYREFQADRGSGALVGREKMILALKRLKQSQEVETGRELKAVQSLCINAKRKTSWMRLFATHPDLDMRIQALEQPL